MKDTPPPSPPPPPTDVKKEPAQPRIEDLRPSASLPSSRRLQNSFRKFTDDGLYLISFSRNYQELIVYRPTWLTFSCKGEDCDFHGLPAKAKKFESFFTQLYCVSLASANELICKDFFLYVENNQFGVFATSTAQVHDAPAIEGATPGVPPIEKITFHLVRLQDGSKLDERVFRDDFVNLAHNMGYMLPPGKKNQDELSNGLQQQDVQGSSFLSGIKQRLLSFVFRGIWNEETDHTLIAYLSSKEKKVIKHGSHCNNWRAKRPSMRVQRLKKKFYFHFQDYIDLIIWKVSRNTDQHPAFFAVYNMETTEVIAFYQSFADELYNLFEQFSDHFHVASRNSLHVNFMSSHSNNIHVLEQLRNIKNKSSCSPQLISATDRHRQSTEHPIKFMSRRLPLIQKFKIKPVQGADTAYGKWEHELFLLPTSNYSMFPEPKPTVNQGVHDSP
ncbi:Light-mediated development protein DET1 [Acorus calamus]|uniref:Light-mediated development protein DET1 n=1 Tax=Acorus calamus TaxID=4465 RepID=A0AAV9DZ18_ACOCL|nr:Light-mediated development protein DET1 [Acorus calamus]